jgi:serine protease
MAKKKQVTRKSPARRVKRPEAPAADSPQSRNPRFEALAVSVAALPQEDASHVVTRLAEKAGLGAWRIEPVSIATGEFELLPPLRQRRPSTRAVWNSAYRLRDAPEVVHAEPLFRYEVPDLHRPAAAPRRAAGGGEHSPATAGRFEWSLEKIGAIEAWQAFGAGQPGAGITIGHPDTGYTPHPELFDPARLLVSQGFDFEADDANPLDDLDGDLLDNPGHGTGTASVIISGRGAAAGSSGPAFVSGVAPFASLIPIRATDSVVLFSTRGLRLAIDHAVAKGAQVISISLGGPLPSSALHSAIQRATQAGVIVLAAAGNQVRFVVCPAIYDEVIAVAASTIADTPWPDSCHGDAVDITAPGASVWRAHVERAAGGGFAYSVSRGSGTSYAVAATAGVAALWLSLHGVGALKAQYGAANIGRVFKDVLQRSCRKPPRWDSDSFGPGIANAAAALREPLPAQAVVRKLRDRRRALVASDATGLEAVLHQLPEAPRAGAERALAEWLHVTDRELPAVLQDVGEELVFQLTMYPALRATLEAQANRPAGARARRSAAQALPLELGSMSSRLAARLRGASR